MPTAVLQAVGRAMNGLGFGRGHWAAFARLRTAPGTVFLRNILGLSALRRVAPFALDLQPARLMPSGCRPDIAPSAVDVP